MKPNPGGNLGIISRAMGRNMEDVARDLQQRELLSNSSPQVSMLAIGANVLLTTAEPTQTLNNTLAVTPQVHRPLTFDCDRKGNQDRIKFPTVRTFEEGQASFQQQEYGIGGKRAPCNTLSN